MSLLWSLIAFVVALSILVAFHEFGHFIVARFFKIKVLKFSVGFGKALWSYRAKSGTEYAISAVPLGGYVKMLGEQEHDDQIRANELPYAFHRQSVWIRMLVVLAGPIFNFLLAIFVYWLMFIIGVTGIAPFVGQVSPNSIADQAGLQRGDEIVAINQQPIQTWQQFNQKVVRYIGNKEPVSLTIKNKQTEQVTHKQLNLTHTELNQQKPNLWDKLGVKPYFPTIKPVVSRVVTNSAAAKAGIQPNDRITHINGAPIKSWHQLAQKIADHPNEQLTMDIIRDGQTKQIVVKPKQITTQNNKQVGRLGIRSEPTPWPDWLQRKRSYPLWPAAQRAVSQTIAIITLTYTLFYKMIMGKISIATISGPIGIAEGAGYSMQLGIGHYLGFLGLISISLGIVNLLPIPILDGGHFLFYVIEAIRQKPLSKQAQEIALRIGLSFIIGLLAIAIYNDVLRLLQ